MCHLLESVLSIDLGGKVQQQIMSSAEPRGDAI